jgi:hypothetical protein
LVHTGATMTWKNINVALREGWRGFAGGSTLHEVLVEHRGVALSAQEQTV